MKMGVRSWVRKFRAAQTGALGKSEPDVSAGLYSVV